MLLFILRRRGIYRPLPGWSRDIARIGACSAAMGAGLWFVQRGVVWTVMPWTQRAVLVLAMVAAAAVLYFALSFALGWRVSDVKGGD
jgi:putative peptidoglycan lipid II flippase